MLGNRSEVHMRRWKKTYLKQPGQLEIKFAATTAQVLHVARKLEGHEWATSDIAEALHIAECQVRSAVGWLAAQSLIEKKAIIKRSLPAEKYKQGKYTVQTYTITLAGMGHEFVRSHRDEKVEHFGNIAALEMALGFCRAFAR